jgi:hypothetical protein
MPTARISQRALARMSDDRIAQLEMLAGHGVEPVDREGVVHLRCAKCHKAYVSPGWALRHVERCGAGPVRIEYERAEGDLEGVLARLKAAW